MKNTIKSLVSILACFILIAVYPAVAASAAEEYPLWIGGEQVTSDNCDDLANNHWSYDPTTHTLTLDDYEYNGVGYSYSGNNSSAIYYNGTDDLTISISGENEITHSEDWSDNGDHALMSENAGTNLTITGSGSLSLEMADTWGGPALSCGGDVVISSGTLNVVGGTTGIYASEVTVKKDISTVVIKACRDSGKAVNGTLINELAGNGCDRWNPDIAMPINTTGSTVAYRVVTFTTKGYALVYYPNGGTGYMDPEIVQMGDTYTLPECSFEAPDGKTFSCWEVSGIDLIGEPGHEEPIVPNLLLGGKIIVTAKWKDAPAATIKTAPKGQDISYTGSDIALVTAGETEDGVMQYVLGEDADTAPTTGWSSDIPTGTDAKTHYVWYRVAGDDTHSNSEKTCITVTIKKADVTVTAKDQKIKEAENAESGVEYAVLSGAASGHTLDEVTIMANGNKLVASGAKIVNGKGEDVTDNYNITYVNGSLITIKKISAKVTFIVVNGEWDKGGSDTIEVVLSGYEGDTLKLNANQIPGVGLKPAANYKPGIWNKTPDTATAITDDTNYMYVYVENPVYTTTVEGNGYVPGSGKDIVFTTKRNFGDEKTFDSFADLTIDGKPVSEEYYTKARGSLIVTLKASYLDTLAEGDHTIKITFTDGEATVTFNVAKAPAAVPKTGEAVNPYAGILLLTGAMGLVIVVPKAYRRKTNAEHKGR